MDRLGDELLAGSALARDEHARPCRGDLLDDVEHLLHRGARPDDVVEAQAILEAGAELGRLVPQAAAVERSPQDEYQLVDLQRLGQVVLRPLLHRPYGRLDLRERGHEHDDELRVGLPRAPQQLDAVHAGHAQVRDEDVGGRSPARARGRLHRPRPASPRTPPREAGSRGRSGRSPRRRPRRRGAAPCPSSARPSRVPPRCATVYHAALTMGRCLAQTLRARA